ncbi:MAG: hypothetical protein SF187_16890 [Deltaproteobacteria bacterium]|nr:hypothetical protein [Deltaproteobacteria bacterium]
MAAKDTDDNGLVDRDEWGPLAVMPLDTDHDGVADFEDVDDDGDALLDVFDSQRLIAADIPLGGAEAVGLADIVVTSSGVAQSFAARPGDTITVSGAGLGCAAWLVGVRVAEPPVNLQPTAVAADSATFVLPPGGYTELFLQVDGRRSLALPLELLPAGAPILTPPPGGLLATPGTMLTVPGVDLAGATQVVLGTVMSPVVTATANTVSVVVPIDAGEGAKAITPSGGSNTVPLAIRHPLAVGIDDVALTPAGVVGPFTIHAGLTPTAAQGSIATASTNAVRPELVTVDGMRAGVPTTVAMAYTLPSDTEVVIGPLSTAIAWSLLAMDLPRTLARSSWQPARTRVAALPEVVALAGAIPQAQALASATDGPAAQLATSLKPLLAAAVAAAGKAIADGIAQGTFAVPAPAPVRADASNEGPLIEPPTRNDVTVFSTGTDGNVGVNNDTSSFLSAEVIDLESKRRIAPHISNMFGPDVIGAQGVVDLDGVFAAKSRNLPGPGFRNARVHVLTGGWIGGSALTQAEKRAHMLVFLRTVLDKVLYPPIKEAVGKVVPDKLLAQLLVTHMFPALSDAYQAYLDQGAKVASAIMLSALKRELEDQGPFLKALATRVIGSATASVVASFAANLAKKVVPGINSALEAFSIGTAVVGSLKAFIDLASLPSRLTFDVIFKMSITRLLPPLVAKQDVANELELKGHFLYPRTVGGVFAIPSVVLEDQDIGGAGRLELLHDVDKMFIASDGRRILVTMPGSYAKRAAGPIKVSVKVGTDIVAAAETIRVMSGFVVDALTPATGKVSDTLTLTGKGFQGRPGTPVKVLFMQAGVSPSVAKAVFATTVNVASDTQLTVVVPTLDPAIATWLVSVQRGAAGNEETSNGKLFSVGDEGPVGVWSYSATSTTAINPCDGEFRAALRIALYPNGAMVYPANNSRKCTSAGGVMYSFVQGAWSLAGETLSLNECVAPKYPNPVDLGKRYVWTLRRNAMGNWEGTSIVTGEPDTLRYVCLKRYQLTPLTGCVPSNDCRVVNYYNADGTQSSIETLQTCPSSCGTQGGPCPYELDVQTMCW